MGFPASHLWRHRGVTIGKTSGIPDSRWLNIRHFRFDQFEKNCSKSDFSWFNRTARAFFFKWLSWFLRYVLAFRTHVLKTHVLEHAFWWILFSNNLWFIKFTHHDMFSRLLGWSGFLFAIQPSKQNSTCQPSILFVHFRGVFPMALGEISCMSQMRLGLKPFLCPKKTDWKPLQA